jgi:hypothetical protein
MTQDIDVGKLAEQINDKADRDLWNTVPNVWNNTLNTSQITNCITEIPQDIKLELKDGTLTLKAGSKVYVPNGAGVFDEVVVKSDIPNVAEQLSGTNKWLLCVNQNGNATFPRVLANCVSGAGVTATAGWVYDTTTNLINWYNASGVKQSGNFSLPVCIISTTDGVPTSIDQVFNGFGYIGSTIFALPGVKGLIPNGRNADGSLKNIEFTTSSVYIFNNTVTRNSANISIFNNGIIARNTLIYDDSLNLNYNGSIFTQEMNCGILSSDSTGRIISFAPKTAFRAVDRNDSSWLSGLGMPSNRYIDLTLGASGTGYTAPANGYFSLLKTATASGQYITLYSFFGEQPAKLCCMAFAPGSGYDVGAFIPARRGDVINISYTAGGTLTYFRFVYAEGE